MINSFELNNKIQNNYVQKIKYYDKNNGQIKCVKWLLNNKLHYYSGDIDNDHPAKIKYNKKGQIIYKKWAINGKYVRYYPTKPSLIKLTNCKNYIVYKWYNNSNDLIEIKKEKLFIKNYFN